MCIVAKKANKNYKRGKNKLLTYIFAKTSDLKLEFRNYFLACDFMLTSRHFNRFTTFLERCFFSRANIFFFLRRTSSVYFSSCLWGQAGKVALGALNLEIP